MRPPPAERPPGGHRAWPRAAAASRVRRLLFVYGTLMAGEDNHHVLGGAPRLRAASTRRGFALVDQGAWPGLVLGGDAAVWGELVAVDAALLARLDAFEDCPEVFERRRIALACGSVTEAYLLRASLARGAVRLRPPCWPTHAAARRRRP